MGLVMPGKIDSLQIFGRRNVESWDDTPVSRIPLGIYSDLQWVTVIWKHLLVAVH